MWYAMSLVEYKLVPSALLKTRCLSIPYSVKSKYKTSSFLAYPISYNSLVILSTMPVLTNWPSQTNASCFTFILFKVSFTPSRQLFTAYSNFSSSSDGPPSYFLIVASTPSPKDSSSWSIWLTLKYNSPTLWSIFSAGWSSSFNPSSSIPKTIIANCLPISFT